MHFHSVLAFLLFTLPAGAAENPLLVRGTSATRELQFDGQVWRTTRFLRADGSAELAVRSDEFAVVLLDGHRVTLEHYRAEGLPEPIPATANPAGGFAIRYVPRPGVALPSNAPTRIDARYTVTSSGTPAKSLSLTFARRTAVNRLEVERFSVAVPAVRGGRGEPVFVDNRWWFGVEYPAFHSRHTDGNTPVADSGYYDQVGNYSSVELERHDHDAEVRPGLIRFFHFPGYGVAQPDGGFRVDGKLAVWGVKQDERQSMELAFLDYLDTVRRPPRSFTHYNNGFDQEGKELTPGNWQRIVREFHAALAPYGIKPDAFVADDGWQNRRSIGEPSALHFPGGLTDLTGLSDVLRAEGTSLGLWLPLNGTGGDIAWGEGNGFARAKPNRYFAQFAAYYSMTQPKYREAMLAQAQALVRAGRLTYLKHDFNGLSDRGDGSTHPVSDRHGHEASVDAMIGLLQAEREANPDIFLNLTHWIWFSPWWLMYGDAFWMLAGDDGFNRNTPDPSLRQMATTDRDTYLWRMWNRPGERPLVPISHLTTHGIIRNPDGQMESPQDTLRDFSDHVVMYYGRGSQLKEWHITRKTMTPDHWKVLGRTHRWAQAHFRALVNTVIVGGRPDEGNAYGYVGWDGDQGILVARNTAIEARDLEVPFDQTTLYRGAPGRSFQARVVYPYQSDWPGTFTSGRNLRVTIPAYSTVVFELVPGTESVPVPARPRVPTATLSVGKYRLEVPADVIRCQLLVVSSGLPPAVLLEGERLSAARTSSGQPNEFAGDARAGMPTPKARPWRMAAYDLDGAPGRTTTLVLAAAGDRRKPSTAEAWLLVDHLVSRPAPSNAVDRLWPIAHDQERQTFQLMRETQFTAAPLRRGLATNDFASARSVRLLGEAFGVDGGGLGDKTIFFNDVRIGTLPRCSDQWTEFSVELGPEARAKLALRNEVSIRTDGRADSFKFRELVLDAELASGQRVSSSAQSAVQTSVKPWAFFEGIPFPAPDRSAPVLLEFEESR